MVDRTVDLMAVVMVASTAEMKVEWKGSLKVGPMAALKGEKMAEATVVPTEVMMVGTKDDLMAVVMVEVMGLQMVGLMVMKKVKRTAESRDKMWGRGR